MAHDFNNLLTVISANTEFARDEPQSTAMTAILDEIGDTVSRAASLTGQILGFVRRSTASLRPLDCRETIAAALPLARRLAGPRIEIRYEAAAEVPVVLAQPDRLDQIVFNLVANARDAMPDGGIIMIAIQPAGTGVEIRFQDTGAGIPPEIRDRIFEPFFTTKGAGEGTGLGLATVATIVAELAGRVSVSSKPGRGTAISIWLPAYLQRPQPGTVPAITPPAQEPGGPLASGGRPFPRPASRTPRQRESRTGP